MSNIVLTPHGRYDWAISPGLLDHAPLPGRFLAADLQLLLAPRASLLLSSWQILPFHLARLPALLIQLLAAWGPTFSALVLTGLISGKAGVRSLLGRLVRWRVGIQWYLFVLGVMG